MIISGGENVYPAEVERVLTEHPGGGARSPSSGSPIRAGSRRRWRSWCRRPGAEVTEDELIEHCRTRLAGYKKPSAVVFADALPRNAAGKVLRRDLRERYA